MSTGSADLGRAHGTFSPARIPANRRVRLRAHFTEPAGRQGSGRIRFSHDVPVFSGPWASGAIGVGQRCSPCGCWRGRFAARSVTGTVWFVGAGPGDPELITVKGRSLIERAGAILFAGSLVNEAATRWAPPGCTIADSKDMTLAQMAAWLIEQARQHTTVIRLQTGDPALYGALIEVVQPLDADTPDGADADACTTTTPGVACSVMAADCLPVLFTNRAGTRVAAAHAGWRGLAAGVLEAALE